MTRDNLKTPEPGDCFALPAGDDDALFAQVVCMWETFKNVAVIRVWSTAVTAADDQFLETPKGESYLLFFEKNLIRRGKWRWLRSLPLGDGLANGLRFQMAGDVFLGDDCLGRASETERASLPKMRVSGDVRVEQLALKILQGDVPPQVYRVPAE